VVPGTPLTEGPLGRGRTALSFMEQFNFFFAFYGLILGLAATEVLKGFGAFARTRSLRKMDLPTALLAVFIFLAICATWIDAWQSLQRVSLDLSSLWAPILLATAYYLAATVVFPRDQEDIDNLSRYYNERKTFVVCLLLAAEFLVNYTYLPRSEAMLVTSPEMFWQWYIPYNVAIKAAFIALLFVRTRRANIIALSALILLFLIPYWQLGSIFPWIHQHLGH
jgi:hypothetical protein